MNRSVTLSTFPSPLKLRSSSEMLSNYQLLKKTTAQLHITTAELEQVNKQRAAYAAANGQVKRLIAKTVSDCQMLKKNHEKLHNESVKMTKATDRLIAERGVMEKECQTLRGEFSALEHTIDRERKEIQRLRLRISEETTSIATFSDICIKHRKELKRKSKERDALKVSAALITQSVEAFAQSKAG